MPHRLESSLVVLRSGLPLVVRGANNGAADRPNIIGTASLSNDEREPDRWFDTSVFVAPPQFTFGNVPRTLPNARGPGFASFDLSLVRNIRFTERSSLQLRAEAFNIFNRTNFNLPNTNFHSGEFSQITTAGEPRRVRLGLKLYF